MHYSWCKVTVVSVIWGKGLYRVCLPQLSHILTNKRVQWRHAFVVCQREHTQTEEILFHSSSYWENLSFSLFYLLCSLQTCSLLLCCWTDRQCFLHIKESNTRRGGCCVCFREGWGWVVQGQRCQLSWSTWFLHPPDYSCTVWSSFHFHCSAPDNPHC